MNAISMMCGECGYLFILNIYLQGIVTRRPLVLQLHKTDDGQQDYAEFLHAPRKRYTDFGKKSF